MRFVLDTSILVADYVEPIEGELAVSAASLAELHYGVLVARDATARATRLRRLVAIERTFDLLPVDAAVSRAYGEIAAAVVAAGQAPRGRTADLLIAATAVAHGARLMTRNPDGLRGAEHLVEIVNG